MTSLSIVIAAIAVYIAWRQWKTASYRLKLDLFERRLKIYRAAKILLLKMENASDFETLDIVEFYREIDEAEFLFSDVVVLFLRDLQSNALKLLNNKNASSENQPITGPEKVDKLTDWMKKSDQLIVHIFREELDFRDVK